MSDIDEDTGEHQAIQAANVVIGQKVYFIDNRERQGGILPASVTQVFPNGCVALQVLDPNVPGGAFVIAPIAYDASRQPGTYHLPK